MNNYISMDAEYVANTYKRYPVAFVSGEGCFLTDYNGKKYIDLGSGIAVNIFGHCDTEWQTAITNQLGKLAHTSNLYTTAPQAELAKALCLKTNMKKVFFSNSGAEANECAIKTARKYAHDNYCPERSTIITLEGSFHGRTVTTLSATGQASFHTDFSPFTEGFIHVPPNDFGAVEALLNKETTAAIMLELIQGEGGVNVLDKKYVEKIAEKCTANDIILIIDEVQTGNGRCGSMYLYEQYGINPDIVTTAKGLGGGLPIGATLLGEKCAATLSAGKHGSTFGGNPVCCAGALNIVSRISSQLLDGVFIREKFIRDYFSDTEGITEITGKGLLLGIKTEKPVGEIISACLEKGVLLLSAKDKLRLLPPLNIDLQTLEAALKTIKGVIRQ